MPKAVLSPPGIPRLLPCVPERTSLPDPFCCCDARQDNPYFTRQAGKARWTLSEAEDTRGAGLWVWGLFKEPLYPFLLLQVNNLEIVSISVALLLACLPSTDHVDITSPGL